MLLFEKLESIGYEKKGNWYIQKNISVNLFTKEVKSSNKTYWKGFYDAVSIVLLIVLVILLFAIIL